MKKHLPIFSAIIAAVIISAFALFSAGAATENDPLISLSYLEDIVIPEIKDEILSDIENSIEDLIDEKLEDYEPSYSNRNENEDEDFNEEAVEASTGSYEEIDLDEIIDSINVSYELLELEQGDTVLAEGICEFIPRPGSTITAVSPFDSQGVADMSNGKEILDGETIPANAYCLIPRGGDGRGFTVQSKVAYIMIRGEYTIG